MYITWCIFIVQAILLAVPADATTTRAESKSKAGIAWPSQYNQGFSKAFNVPGNDLGWWWNWAPRPLRGSDKASPPGQYAGTVFQADTDTSVIPAECPVLTFNEPDKCGPGQTCMIKEGNLKASMPGLVDNWVKAVVPLIKNGRDVGSPAPADRTIEFLTEFFAVCKARTDCKLPTFISMHAYVRTAEELQKLVTDVHNAFKMPIWLTEFACHHFGSDWTPTQEYVHSFMGATTKWLDKQPFVQRYSWLGAGKMEHLIGVNKFCRLQDDDGNLTALGRQYVFRRYN